MAEKRPKVGLRGTEGRAKAKPGSRKRQLEPVVVVEDDDDDEPFVPEPKAKKREPPRVELSGPVAKTKTLGLRRPRPARRNCFYSLVFFSSKRDAASQIASVLVLGRKKTK